MKSLKTTLIVSLAIAVTACASTNTYTHTPLTLESESVYKFSDDKSFALNVAHMTGKTTGLRDRALPESAQHRIGGAELGLAFGSGALANGLLSLSSTALVYGIVISDRNWKPMYVLTDLDYSLRDDPMLNEHVERLIDLKLREAFSSEQLGGYEYVGLAHTNKKQSSNYNIFYSGEECFKGLKALGSENGLPAWFGDYGVFGPIQFDKPTCNAPFRVSIERPVAIGDETRLVIVMEQIGSYSFVSKLASSIDGYSVIPEVYQDLDGTRYSHEMPFVVHDNYLHVFSKDYAPLQLN